jgi:hypothetical protein
MPKKSLSMRLPDDILDHIKNQSGPTGDALNNILDCYISLKKPNDLSRVAEAISRHIKRGATSALPVRPTTVYMDPGRIRTLRAAIARTHLTFEGVLRIILEDHLAQHPTAD